MRYRGYKLNGYNATYTQAVFEVREQQNGVLEVTDIEGGITFLVDFGSVCENPKRRTSKWRKDEPKEQGTHIAFGSKGFLEKLKYSGLKPKDGI